MKKEYHIRILDQSLSVVSDSGDDHVADVVQCVETRVNQIRAATGGTAALNIAILVALNIADEYIKLAEANKRINDEFGTRAENLISLIDNIE